MPLLAPGRHNLSLARLEAMCVTAFPGNQRRAYLFRLLEEFVAAYGMAGIRCQFWIDGSFLTEKPYPLDLDVTVIIEADVVSSLTVAQNDLVDRTNAERGYADDLDTFALICKGRDDPEYYDEALNPAISWGEQYGREHNGKYVKGFGVIRLGESNVGLRICR